jgi:hypothetical protein
MTCIQVVMGTDFGQASLAGGLHDSHNGGLWRRVT